MASDLPVWAPGARAAEGNSAGHVFSMGDGFDDEYFHGGLYEVPHYPEMALGKAFGPLNLVQLLRFCSLIEGKLKAHSNVVIAPQEGDDRINAAVLFGSFLILRRGWNVSEVAQKLASEAKRTFVCSWARSSETQRLLTVQDCWAAIEMALRLKWVDPSCIDDALLESLAYSQYRRTALVYDASWLVPGRIAVAADPVSTVKDPNPVTCDLLTPSDLQDEASLESASDIDDVRSPSEAHEGFETHCHIDVKQQGVVSQEASRWSSTKAIATTNVDSGSNIGPSSSCHTVCKDYENSSTHSHGSNTEAKAFTSWMSDHNIRLVARMNASNERGLSEYGGSYDSRVLEKAGIDHLNLPLPDTDGAVPPAKAVQRVLERFDDICVDSASAMLVHCKGGFGRSVVMACCILMHEYDVPGRQLLAWARIVRPGAITTVDQERFLCRLSGRESLRRWMNANQQACCKVS